MKNSYRIPVISKTVSLKIIFRPWGDLNNTLIQTLGGSGAVAEITINITSLQHTQYVSHLIIWDMNKITEAGV